MGDCDNHDVVLSSQRAAVVEDRVARSRTLTATVEPDHHRPAPAIDGRCPHVHTQTVFVHRAAAGQRITDLGNHRAERLPRTWSVFDGIDDAGPGLWLDGRLESIGAGCRGTVPDPLERHDAILRPTTKPTGGCVNHRTRSSPLGVST